MVVLVCKNCVKVLIDVVEILCKSCVNCGKIMGVFMMICVDGFCVLNWCLLSYFLFMLMNIFFMRWSCFLVCFLLYFWLYFGFVFGCIFGVRSLLSNGKNFVFGVSVLIVIPLWTVITKSETSKKSAIFTIFYNIFRDNYVKNAKYSTNFQYNIRCYNQDLMQYNIRYNIQIKNK